MCGDVSGGDDIRSYSLSLLLLLSFFPSLSVAAGKPKNEVRCVGGDDGVWEPCRSRPMILDVVDVGGGWWGRLYGERDN